MNNLCFVSFTNFEHKFKISILSFSNFNSSPKLQNFNIPVTYFRIINHTWMKIPTMRLCHPPDGSTSPKYKLPCFITTKKICKEKNVLAFNRDRCCRLVLCLRLIPFHLLVFSFPFMEIFD